MRLDHFLALASIGTKKNIRELIYSGAISVNDSICRIPSTTIDTTSDSVSYLGSSLHLSPVYYVLNKPQNCITAREPNTPNVFDCFSDIDTTGLFASGRLDKDTEGLLIITNDGNFSNQLMAPENHISKTYQFLSLGHLSQKEITLLETGMDIGDDIFTKPASVRILKTGYYSDLSKEIGAHKMKRIKKQPANQLAFIGEIIISEGKKHQVKRMLRGVHCPVIYLKRIAIGGFTLPVPLESGAYLQMSKSEILSACYGLQLPHGK